MKLNLSKEWLTKHANRDDKVDVSAGVFSIDMLKYQQHTQKISSIDASAEDNPRPAFGKLINLWRRKKGWRMEDLAEKANIDLAEIIEIERDMRYTPEPRTVYQLSRTLGLSNERMLQLSGNVIASMGSTRKFEGGRFGAMART